MKLRLLWIASSLAALCLTACKLTDNGEDVVIKIDPEFELNLFEELSDTRHFQFQIASIDKQACSNASVNSSLFQYPTHLALHLIDVSQPDTCIAPSAPAKGLAKTTDLLVGQYELRITLSNAIVNTGSLEVKNDVIKATMKTNDGIEWVHSELRRIPNQSIWGYVAFTDPATEQDRAANFVNDIKGICQTDGLSKGYYGYFDLAANGELSLLESQPDFQHIKTFHFRLPGQVAQLEDLLTQWRNAPGSEQMEFKIFTWEGDSL